MKAKLARTVLPALIVVLGCLPAAAQVRLGVEIGPLSIRVAPDAPPPPRREVVVVRPSRDHVWIDGYWNHDGRRWAWVPGRWEIPSHRDSVWIKPQYVREAGQYRYEPGHWSHEKMVEAEEYSRFHREHMRDREEEHHHGH